MHIHLKNDVLEAEKLSRPKSDEPVEVAQITKEDVSEKFSMASHRKRSLVFMDVKGNPSLKAAIEKGVHPTVIQTVNEVRKILQSRRGGKRRCIPKGYLDKAALWKVAVKEPNIFMKKNAPSNDPDLAVYLLLDCSGSMRALGRLYDASKAGVILHNVCRELNIPHAAKGFTTDICTPLENVLHYNFKEFHESKAKIESMVEECICIENVDGYSIRVAASELLTRPETNKVLFVISDGLPEATKYGGKRAVDDTARAVREAMAYRIGVIGIFIGDERNAEDARYIYPSLVFLEKTVNLPFILAKNLEKVITSV